MPDIITRRELIKRIGLGSAIAAIGGGPLLLQISCSSQNANETQKVSQPASNEQQNSNQLNQNANQRSTLMNPPAGDQTADNIVRVVDKWSGDEKGVFLRELSLRGQWEQSHSIVKKYDPVGISSLISELKKNAFFKVHHRIGELKSGLFVEGGDIQTEGGLYDFFTA